ncbi:MAG: hypothetical protein K6E81_06830 [Lachnospiraceae bacterium]|nr:hypothetical protein [Lachnospiraceae bacterium]
MGCFIVPAVEAAAVTIASKVMKNREKETEEVQVSLDGEQITAVHKLPMSEKLSWLAKLQWGGAALLAFEHVWHGEVVPWFPFLTAMSDPVDAAEMFHEMGTVGVGMAILTTAVWAGMFGVSRRIEKRAMKEASGLAKAK